MKALRIPLLFAVLATLIAGCATPPKAPGDAEAEKAIRAVYTADNDKDGAEYCTVRSLTILDKKMLDERTCRVKYHIDCYYSGPAMPPGYEREERPAINTDSTAVLKKQKDSWQMEGN